MLKALYLKLAAALILLLAPSASQAQIEWKTQRTDHFDMRWAPDQDTLGKELTARAESHHARIFGELGAPLDTRISVTLAPDEAQMLALAQAENGSRPPEWAAGLAYPSKRLIYLHAATPAAELDSTFQHEISHVAVGALTGGRRVPRWFSEGLAIRQSEGISFERGTLLLQASGFGGLMPLAELEKGFPKGSGRAGVAYAQSVHLVGHLQGEFGNAAFTELLKGLGDGETFAEAAHAAFGRSMGQIEADWRDGLEIWWGWIPLAVSGTALWGVAAFLLVLGWRRKIGARQRRMAQLRALEMMDMADDIEIAHNLRPPPSLHDPYDGRPPTVH